MEASSMKLPENEVLLPRTTPALMIINLGPLSTQFTQYYVPANVSYTSTSFSQLDCKLPEGRIYRFLWEFTYSSAESLNTTHIVKL